MLVALLAFALSAEQLSSDGNGGKSKDHKPISKNQELGITLGIEFGLVTLGVVCYFAFRNSLTLEKAADVRVYPDFGNSESEESSHSSKSDAAPAQNDEAARPEL